MRIIAGRCRGLKLTSLEGLATRPTADRVKEAVFSSIAAAVPGAQVLDLFAGSGALGLEALSRGADRAVFVDDSAPAMAVVRQNVQRARMEASSQLVRSDWRAFARAYTGEGFDLVFLDPPYKLWGTADLLDVVHTRGLLAPGGLAVAESDSACLPRAAGLRLEKHKTYGKTAITLWRAL